MMRLRLPWIAALALAAGGAAGPAPADAPPSGREIAERVNARPEGDTLERTIRMELVDRHGSVRVRETRTFRENVGDERRSVLFFESPKNIRGTAFLTHDHIAPGREDDQWLYLPAARKVRRISAADRGDYFLGTDLTYDDMKNEGRLSLSDYRFQNLGREDVDGRHCWKLEGTPVSKAVADELGYGRVQLWVDPDLWMVVRSEIWDVNGNPLKTVRFGDIQQVDGIWTPFEITAVNHKTGHETVLRASDVHYRAKLDDRLFTASALRRGP